MNASPVRTFAVNRGPCGVADCIQGFKFIGNTALQLVKEGYEVPVGYEEAIGYMFGDEIRDKDGVAASVSECRL